MFENRQKGSPKQAIYGCGTTSDAFLKNRRNEGSYNNNGFIVREWENSNTLLWLFSNSLTKSELPWADLDEANLNFHRLKMEFQYENVHGF